MRLMRLMPAAQAVPWSVLPLFPAFITLTAVTVPGTSLVPPLAALALLFLMGLMAIYGAVVICKRPIPRQPLGTVLTIWLLAGLLAAALGFDPRAGMLFLAIFGLGMIWHFALLRYYSAPGVCRAVYWSYAVSGGLASLAAIAMVAVRRPALQYAIGHGRAIGTFILPGELAGYLIVFLPVMLALARLTSNRRLRVTAWSAFGAGAIAFLLTFSRAGWMGMAAAIAFYAFFSGRIRRRYAPLILLAGLAAVLVVFNAHHNPAENYTRLSIWQAGIEIARRFPLTGVGPFDFARIYPLVRLPDGDAQAFHAHSFLLTIFAETGLVGVAAVLGAWVTFAAVLRDRLRAAPPARTALALAIAAGLAGTWVQGLIDTVTVVIFGLWLPAMALALSAAADGLGELG